METKINERTQNISYNPSSNIVTQIQCFEATNIESLQDGINKWLTEFSGIQIMRVDIHQAQAPYYTTHMYGIVVYKMYVH